MPYSFETLLKFSISCCRLPAATHHGRVVCISYHIDYLPTDNNLVFSIMKCFFYRHFTVNHTRSSSTDFHQRSTYCHFQWCNFVGLFVLNYLIPFQFYFLLTCIESNCSIQVFLRCNLAIRLVCQVFSDPISGFLVFVCCFFSFL